LPRGYVAHGTEVRETYTDCDWRRCGGQTISREA